MSAVRQPRWPAFRALFRTARLSAELLVGRKAVLLLVADALLCFLFLILILSGGGPRDLYFIVLLPVLILGLPVMADAVGVERRAGTLDLALSAPSGPRYFLIRLAAVSVPFALQGTALLIAASAGIQRFHVVPAIASCWLGAAVAGAVALAWATVLRGTGPAILASLLTLAVLGEWFLEPPIFDVAQPAFGMTGWIRDWLPSAAVLSGASVAALWLSSRRLSRPETVLTGRSLRREGGSRSSPGPPWASPSPPPPSIRLDGVGKDFSDRTVLNDVSTLLAPGVTGLLGANGAGKTTLIRIITGLLEPTRGRVSFGGMDAEPRRLVGFLPQDFFVYPGMSGVDFLEFWALQQGIVDVRQRRREIDRVLEAVGLTARADRTARDLSGGMRQRLGIARALLGSPPVLILDEPSAGLDLPSRELLRSILLQQGEGRIVLLSTHVASDLEAVASRVIHLAGGGLSFAGPLQDFVNGAPTTVVEVLLEPAALPSFRREHHVVTARRSGDRYVVRALCPPGSLVLEGQPAAPSLEEAYLARSSTGTGRERGKDPGRSSVAFLGEPLGPIAAGPRP